MSGIQNKLLAMFAKSIKTELSEAEAETLLQDAEITKAMSVTPVPDVMDELHHSVPSKETINVGPSEEASGSGAERMISQYSATTPQHGITMNAEHLGMLLGNLQAIGKSVNQQTVAITSLTKSVEENREMDVDHAIAVIAAHAKSNVEEALAKLEEASEMAVKARTIKSVKTKKSVEQTERKLVKSASKILEDIRGMVEFVNDDKLTASFNEAAIKAEDVDVVDDEDEDDMEPEVKTKKAKKADMDAGDDDDHEPEEEKAKANLQAELLAQKAALTAMQEKIEQTLKGQGMMQTDLNGLFAAVSNQPKNKQGQPDQFSLMKSNPATISVLSEKIDNSNLTDSDSSIALNILGKLSGVHSGAIDHSVVTKMINGAPATVKRIFDHVAS